MAFSQSYFEGEVIYSNKFTSKVDNLTSLQLETIVGNRQEYFIRNGDYRSQTNGYGIVLQIYNASTNRIYNKTTKSDTLYWFDASANLDKVISFEIVKNREEILEVMCDALILKTTATVTTYYYNRKYKADADLYTNHQFGNWYYMLTKTSALPLKTVIENQQFIMESTAIEIKPMSLSDRYFVIKEGTALKQSR